MSKERIAIFDIDGCVANDEWRRGRIPAGACRAADYVAYHAACSQDPPLSPGLAKLEEHVRNGDFIAFLTARPMAVGKDTCEWIEGHVKIQRNKDFMILMRKDDDERSSVDLKREQLDMLAIYARETSRQIAVGYDDRTDIVDMYLKNGVPDAFILDKNGQSSIALATEPARAGGTTVGEVEFRIDGQPITIEDVRRAGLAVRDAQIAEEQQKTPGVNQHFTINVEGGEKTADDIVKNVLKNLHVSVVEPDSIRHIPSELADAADILEGAASTFRERNAVYKDNAFVVGQVMKALFPEGVTLRDADDHHVYHLFELMIVKLTRFTQSGLTHKDSLRDLAVYAAMIESIVDIHNIDTHEEV